MIGPSRAPNGIETRATAEVRVAGRRLEGYAATFNVPAQIGSFSERIAPGAFSTALRGPDILALVDHDAGKLLARTRSGTLRLNEDGHGLAFSLDVPDTTLGRDILAMAQRGDLGGCSFAFRPTDERWSADRAERELRAVDLAEISIVHAWPAYSGTTVAARSQAGAADLAAARRRTLALL